uniref:probable G-protein coupled receptor 139 n=1 Tax=Pristiophorus japonicus TaxID=55135 RepID=UPI00398F3C0B
MTGTDLNGFQSSGAHVVLCPQRLYAFDQPVCGFKSEGADPMEVMAQGHVPPNLVSIVILSRGKCGLSKVITRCLLAMAVSDLVVIIIEVILRQIIPLYFGYNFLRVSPACNLQTVLRYASECSSVWLTVCFTFDRFLAICHQKLSPKYCTEQTATVVIATVSGLSCFISLPWYFIYELHIGTSCIYSQGYISSPLWAAFEIFQYIFTPLLAIFLNLLLNSLTVRYILVASRVRRRLRAHRSGETDRDPEMENRRKSITLLFAISVSFILLWLTYFVNYTLLRIAFMTRFRIFIYSPVAQEVGIMLQLLSCSTNTCIYAVTQRKFREELKNGVKYPFKLIVKLVKE